MKHFYAAGAVRIFHGDCRDVQATFDADSLDACVTDPPYELGFMGKPWDQRGVAFDPETWRAVLRVLKPGAHLVAAGGTRTHHRLMCAIEDAGFEIRDTVMWLYGSGFPKSLDVSKAIDKTARRDYVQAAIALGIPLPDNTRWDWTTGEHSPSDVWWERFRDYLSDEQWAAVEREIIGHESHSDGTPRFTNVYGGGGTRSHDLTAPATAAARQWEGWGTALKPAWEPIIVARKPLTGTVAANVLEHGTGALNIDGCRIGTADTRAPAYRMTSKGLEGGGFGTGAMDYSRDGTTAGSACGRWPANLVLSHTPDCRQAGTRNVKGGNFPAQRTPSSIYGGGNGPSLEQRGGARAIGTETVAAWSCVEDCPVRLLDEQSGERPSGGQTVGDYPSRSGFGGGKLTASYRGDTGGASRFFYTAKASRRERECGLPPGLKADHPTVKPVALMRWLVRLVTPPGGTVLDPFMGSGSTKLACEAERFGFVGIDLDEHYCEIAKARKLLPGVASEAAQLGL